MSDKISEIVAGQYHLEMCGEDCAADIARIFAGEEGMATDRMYLACECGAEIAIARYLMPPWYAYDDLSERLTAWFEEHQDCDEQHYPARPTLRFGSDGPPPEKTVAFYEQMRANQPLPTPPTPE